MTNYSFVQSIRVLCALLSCANSFQTSQMLPLRIDPIVKAEIAQRLGLKEKNPSPNDCGGALSIGSGPNMGYALTDEHEALCPISGVHQGVLCTATLSHPVDGENAASIADDSELVSQAIMAGSLAVSVRNRCAEGNGVYYLPVVITLVESLMADEMRSLELGQKVFNSGGLETNEILMDCSGDGLSESVLLYACNTLADHNSATSDVYVMSPEKKGKVWRFSMEFKVATINLRQISSFGDRDSTTPLRPEVWLKDDSY